METWAQFPDLESLWMALKYVLTACAEAFYHLYFSVYAVQSVQCFLHMTVLFRQQHKNVRERSTWRKVMILQTASVMLV